MVVFLLRAQWSTRVYTQVRRAAFYPPTSAPQLMVLPSPAHRYGPTCPTPVPPLCVRADEPHHRRRDAVAEPVAQGCAVLAMGESEPEWWVVSQVTALQRVQLGS